MLNFSSKKMISTVNIMLGVASIFTILLGLVSTTDYGVFWQITDLHLDPKYSIHGNRCKGCHQGTSDDETKLEDFPGKFGDPRCEAPWSVVESAVAAMKRILSNPDFILWTGDTVAVTSKLTQEERTNGIMAVTDLLVKSFNQSHIIPVLGDCDVVPPGQMPPTDLTYYQGILKDGGWAKILPSDTQKTFGKGGYYSFTIKPGLSVVVLNTNLYYTMNHLTKQMTDPAGMFKWLREYLKERKRDKHKVILVAHVPPGANERAANMFHMYPQFNEEYIDIIRTYSDVIGSQIYAHERNDTFRVFLGEDGQPINVGIIAPPVSPYTNSNKPEKVKANPGIRLVKYDRDSGNILDIFQYHLDLDAANKAKKANWKLKYQFTKAMSVTNLKPTTLYKLVQSFSRENGLKLFHALYSWSGISSSSDNSCDKFCQKVYLCAVLHADFPNYNDCIGKNMPEKQIGAPNAGPDSATSVPTHPITNTSGNNLYDPSLYLHHHGAVPKSVIYLVMTIGLLVLAAFLAVTIYIHKRRKLYPKVSYHRVPEFDYD